MLKQLCVSLAALAVASAAVAADITNPFYLPTKGQVGSITSGGFEKSQLKNENNDGKLYTTSVTEELQYGITNKLALIAGIGNSFVKGKFSSTEGTFSDKEDENMNWGAGLAWNIFDQAFKLQAKATYLQDKLYSEEGEYKSIFGEIKMGYQFDKMLPYISVAKEMPVAQTKGLDKPIYYAKVGLYQGKCETWGLDTGIRWMHSENGEYNAYDAEAEASYYLTKNSAVSVYGTYAIDGKAKDNSDYYDKSVGLRLRWFF